MRSSNSQIITVDTLQRMLKEKKKPDFQINFDKNINNDLQQWLISQFLKHPNCPDHVTLYFLVAIDYSTFTFLATLIRTGQYPRELTIDLSADVHYQRVFNRGSELLNAFERAAQQNNILHFKLSDRLFK